MRAGSSSCARRIRITTRARGASSPPRTTCAVRTLPRFTSRDWADWACAPCPALPCFSGPATRRSGASVFGSTARATSRPYSSPTIRRGLCRCAERARRPRAGWYSAAMPALTTPPLGLYLHFPWCVRKCPYCDFNSYTLTGELPQQAYLGRLTRDLAAQAPQVAGREVTSVFLGGGTPSLFSPRSIGELLAAARRHLSLAADLEVTLEANPGAIERGAFREYRAAGVTRVSLGAQSFDPGRLSALGRIHSPAETRRAAEELHAAGLDNFNLDLMYALPGQDVAAALRDVTEALALAPGHLSHYQLTLEPGTLFAARPPPLPDEDAAAAMLDGCAALLAQAGVAPLEVAADPRARPQGPHHPH